MEDMLLNQGYRQTLIEEIKGSENVDRLEESLRDTEVYNGKIYPYVTQELLDMYGESSHEYPVVASINVAKKVVNSKASIYREPPNRDIQDLTEEQSKKLLALYDSMDINRNMSLSNKYYELQGQNHILIMPKDGRLKMRVLKNHQLNVVPKVSDPEEAEIYILSSFNKSDSDLREDYSDGQNQKIGDLNDYDAAKDMYVVWSKKYHFLMDGNGTIISVDETGEPRTENPIAPVIPIVEITSDKDFEYWTRKTAETARFTVSYNTMQSNLSHIANMQGHAQAYLKAPADLMPQSVKIGPSYLLKLTTDPHMEGDVEFGFANPNADIKGVQDHIVSVLSQFLTTQGLDANAINASNTGGKTYASGVERLLAMVEKFEASKDTLALYKDAEREVFAIVVAWMNVLKDTDRLRDEFKASIPEDSTISISFNRPEGTITETEMLDALERKQDLGIISRIDMIMKIEDKTREEAIERLEEIDADNEGSEDKDDKDDDGSEDQRTNGIKGKDFPAN